MLNFTDLRYGFRQLRNRPGFTAITILTLALGIGANTAIFSVVKGVLFETAPFDRAENLVWIGEHSEQVPSMSVAYPNFIDWRESTGSFEALAAHRYHSFNLTGLDRPEQLLAVYASPSLFSDVLRVEPFLGRGFSAEEDRPGQGAVTVVTHSFWQRRLGGDEDAIGRRISLDGESYEVIGVMPPGFVYPLYTDRIQLWLPIGHIAGESWMQERSNHPGIYVTARLNEGVTFDQAHDEMKSLAASLAETHPETNTGNGISMHPLRDFVVRDMQPAILVLSGAVFLVLLIACVNVANLLLVRGSSRAKEIAVRSALGAGHWRVARQLLTESVLLAVLGGLAGILVAYGSLRLLLNSIDRDALPVVGSIELDAGALAFTFVLSILTGIFFGAAPAVQAVRRDQVESLKDGSKGSEGGHRQRLRSVLVAAQIALALVLVAGSLLFLQSFSNLIQADAGFDPEAVLTFDITLSDVELPEEAQQTAFLEAFLARIRALPQVESASTTLPLLGGWQTSIRIEGRPEPERGKGISVDITRVGTDYFEVMGVDLQKGRRFDDRDRADSLPVAMVDRSFVDTHLAGEDPLGKRIRFSGEQDPWLEIVGVVDHVKNYGVAQDSRTEVYLPAAQDPVGMATFVLKTRVDDRQALMASVESELSGLSAGQPLANPRLLTDIVGETVLADRVLASLLSVFGALAMLLAALGIYGVMAFHVTERKQEIGIRMALGASSSQVLRWIGFQGLRLVAAGVMVGMVGVFWGAPLLGAQLFGVEPRDPVTLTVLPLMLMAVAVLACIGPLSRAGRVEPIVALRHE